MLKNHCGRKYFKIKAHNYGDNHQTRWNAALKKLMQFPLFNPVSLFGDTLASYQSAKSLCFFYVFYFKFKEAENAFVRDVSLSFGAHASVMQSALISQVLMRQKHRKLEEKATRRPPQQ